MSQSILPMSSSEREDSRLWGWGCVLAGVGAAWLVLLPSSATRIHAYPWTIWIHAYGLGLALFVLARLAIAPARIPRLGGGLDATLAVAAGIFAVAAIQSPYAHQSLLSLPVLVAGLATPYVTGFFLVDRDGRLAPANLLWLAQTIALLGAVVALWALVQWGRDIGLEIRRVLAVNQLAGDDILVPRVGEIRAVQPFGHANYLGGFTLAILPIAVALAWIRNGWERIAWIFAALIVILALYASGSRGALFALGPTAAVALILAWRRRTISTRRILFLAVFAAAAAAVAAVTHPRIRTILAGEGHGVPSVSDIQRAAMIDAGIRMGGDRPFLGWGPGVTALVYPRYRAHLEGGAESVLQIHSTPLQFWVDGGLVLVGTVCVFGGLLLRRWRRLTEPASDDTELDRLRRRDEPHPMTTIRAAAIVGLAGYAMFSVTDYQLDVPGIAILCGVLIRLSTLCGDPETSSDRHAKHTVPAGTRNRPGPAAARIAGAAGCALALVYFAAISLPGALARRNFDAAISALERNDVAMFVRHAEFALDRTPWDFTIANTIAWAHGEHAMRLPAEESAVARNAAVEWYKHSLWQEPYQEIAHFNLGWLLLNEDPGKAAFHFRQASELIPDKGGVYLGRAAALIRTGDAAGAIHALILEWLNDPVFQTAPVWGLEPFRSIRPAVAEDVFSRAAAIPESALGSWRTGLRDRWLKLARALENEIEIDFPMTGRGKWLKNAMLDPDSAAKSVRHWFLASYRAEPSDAWIQQVTALLKEGAEPFPWRYRPAGDLPTDLVKTYRRQRIGYPVLMKNLDLPAPFDFFWVQENPFFVDGTKDWFPFKGWLPPHVLEEAARPEQ